MAVEYKQFSMPWNNFGANLSSGLHESLCREEFIDVTLAAEGHLVRAHRLILSAYSPYFREMFTHMPSHQHGFVFLKDVSYTALKDLIQFMYSGEVNMKQEDLPTFISTAEALQVKGLPDENEALIKKVTDPLEANISSTPFGKQSHSATQSIIPNTTVTASSTTRSQSADISHSTNPQLRLSSQVHTALPTRAPSVQTIVNIAHDDSVEDVPIVKNTVQKRSAGRRGTPKTAPAKKRSKIDPLARGDVPQIVAEIIHDPAVSVDVDYTDHNYGTDSGHQDQQQQVDSQIETKIEPVDTDDDSNDEIDTDADVTTGDDGRDIVYAENYSYGDIKYDDSCFTDNDDDPKPGTSKYTEFTDGNQSTSEQQDVIDATDDYSNNYSPCDETNSISNDCTSAHHTDLDNRPSMSHVTNNNEPSTSFISNTIGNNKDLELKTLLESWKLPEIYYKFKERNINVKTMRMLTPRHIDQLFNKIEDFRTKVKFEYHLNVWKNVDKNTSGNSEINIAEEVAPSNNKNNPVILLSELLNNANGKMILSYHNENKKLSEITRQLLVDTIIDHFIHNNIPLSVATCNRIAEQIIVTFPKEIKDYYFAYQKNAAPKGRLFNKFQNVQRKLRVGGIIQPYKRQKLENTKDICSIEPEKDSEDTRVWLLHNREPWSQVEQAWKSTVNLRKLHIMENNQNLSHVIDNWNVYKHSLGHNLIDIDFENFFPNRNMFVLWEQYSKKILNLLDQKIREVNCRQVLNILKTWANISTDGTDATIMWLIHAVLLPSAKKLIRDTTGKRKFMKFSIRDSQDSFMTIVKSAQELDAFIQDKEKEKLPIQPFIILFGPSIQNPETFYVYFDKIKYKLCSFLRALDVCFKIYMTLNLKYPKQSITVWQFIQNFLYCTYTKHDIVLPSINCFINEIKNSDV